MKGQVAPLSVERQALVLSVMRLIEQKVTQLAPWAQGAAREDLVSAARTGASVAAARFATSYGTRFQSYAAPYIAGAIKDHLGAERRQRGLVFQAASSAGRDFVAEHPDNFKIIWDDAATNHGRLENVVERHLAAMYAGVAGAPLANPEEQAVELETRQRAVQIVKEVVQRSPEVDRRIYALRYEERATLTAIAQTLSIDERTVRRHHEALLDRVAAVLHERGISEFPLSP